MASMTIIGAGHGMSLDAAQERFCKAGHDIFGRRHFW
jgi:hypothetical protein